MAAPTGIVWGPIAGGYGRIGIYRQVTNSTTQSKLHIEIWFWSKYSVSDSANTLYYTEATSSGSSPGSLGAVSVSTSVASGSGWSTSNQQKLYSKDTTYNRGTSDATKYLIAKLADVDRVGATMVVNTTATIPKKPSYTVSYNANGGSGAPSSQTKWYGTNLTLSSTKPTRTGYSFKGWGTSASDTSVDYAAGATYSENTAITLYAIWTANTFTVSYNANGGSGAPSNQTKTYGVALTLSSTKPTRTDYEFLGWGTSANATTATYSPGSTYTANKAITLYAVWRLAYTKPRITNLKVDRCDKDGILDENGTYAKVSFSGACDKNVSSVSVDFETESGTVKTYSLSWNGGSVTGTVGAGSLNTETTYAVTVTVTDAGGSSYAFSTLPGTKFVIDFRKNGSGAAFGKPAELDGVLDIGFQTRFFGGQLPVVLDSETDLNNVRTPNTYTGANVTTYNYVNCPVSSGTFTLIVESGGESGQIRQTYISCSKYKPERFVRFYYQSAWGDWFWAGTEEYVLYENSAGSNGIITLNAAISHYRYIEIYFTDNGGRSGGYTKVWDPDGKTVCLSIVETSSTTSVLQRQTMYTLSANTMVPKTDVAGYLQFNPSTKVISNAPVGTNYIKIVRVIGRA